MDRGLADLMRGGVEFDVDDAEGTMIETVRGVGYRLTQQVALVPVDPN